MEAAPPPIVSVIIPAYNAARLLPETLSSVQAQTLRDWEAIVIDDGSSDDTAAVVAEFVARDARIRYLRQANAGVGAARNRGIAEARGKYVAPLDADDIWLPTKLEKQVACLEAGGEAYGFCYCWSKTLNGRGELTDILVHWEVEGRAFHQLIYRNIIGNASVPLIRKTALDEVGGYITREEQGGAQGCEDWDITLRLAEKYLLGEVREPLVGYRESDLTMSKNTSSMERSYRYTLANLRRRNPKLPGRFVRWSSGHFYLYLLNISYFTGNYRECFRLIPRIIAIDPLKVLTPTLYRVAPMCILRQMFGGQFLHRVQSHSQKTEEPWSVKSLLWLPSHWIEKRRWREIKSARI